MTWTPSRLFRSVLSGRGQRRRPTLEILEDRTLLSLFTLPRSVFMANGAAPQSVAVADFNGDGRADVAVVDTGSHSVIVLQSAGNCAFQPVAIYTGTNHPLTVTAAVPN